MEPHDANQSGVNAIERGEKGHFLPGKAPISPGRPKGSISIIGRIKQKFEESPELFEKYVAEIMEDDKLRAQVMSHIDGAPKQSIQHELPQSLVDLLTHVVNREASEGLSG